ncbi:MAG TPA: glycoside hydrolase family 2 TIM barrel-domain containing protein [Gemmatimonadales bacterium]|jgi:hypothetical protein
MTRRASCIVALITLVVTSTAIAQQPASHLRTRWAAEVSPDHVWPEYPRPQLVRPRWTNLDGSWDYAITALAAAVPAAWDGQILVPFPVQSQLSGVTRAVSDSQLLWYHRSFAAPALASGERLLLHFGAVDWETTVTVNGVVVGTHRGGYDPFTFDITSALHHDGPQQLVVEVRDPTNHGPQPRGKQVLAPRSIWYTAVTGIWQTVWLEPVPAAHITSVVTVPNIDTHSASVDVGVEGAPIGTAVTVTAMAAGRVVARVRGQTGTPVVLHLAGQHLWSTTDPFLYDLRVTLAGGDSVGSYFGMRKIALGPDSAGVTRLFLNNKPLFEYGTLDQGWWPDGLYTAPTDAAMRYDIDITRQLGFNMIRKHVKVEPERWYYYTDKIGMLVWQDMPSGDNNTPAGKLEFEEELHHVVDALRAHPSIVMWIPFNEGWGQHDTERYVAWLKAHDPSRLVDNATGWTDKGVGDVSDVHDYPGPAMPPLEPHRAAVLGEFGGLGLPLEGHTWLERNNWGYRTYTSTTQLGAAYSDLMGELRLLEASGLAAAVYTQTTDVEVEVNGLMTYDRAVIKLPPEASATAKALFGPMPAIRVVVPTSQTHPQMWHYTTTAPVGAWFAPTFNDSSWALAAGGFGTRETPGAVVGTQWQSSDIWLRRTVTLGAIPLTNPYWHLHHDDDAEVYVNGTLAAKLSGYTSGYVHLPLDQHARALLHPGVNTLAIHVHQVSGGQFIDLGLDEVIDQ